MENKKIYNRINELIEKGQEFAIAQIISAGDGTPRKSGTKMVVFPDGKTEFTIGGGNLEELARRKSVKAIKSAENKNFSVEFDEEKSGMVCGGQAEVFIEVFKTPHHVLLFGGGHIGLALSKILDVTGMPYKIYDDREDFASSQRFPGAEEVDCIDYKDTKDIEVNGKSYCVVVTHGHKGDREVLKELLKTPAPYLGMIGSVNKVNTVLETFDEDFIKENKDRIYAPIGLELGGDTPSDIALSIASEILKVKNNKSGKSLSRID
ncbi:MAG: XdhC family protein [Elusimicrobiota bacterium]